MEKIKALHAYLLFALTRHLQHQCSSSGLGLGLQAGSQTPPALSCSACLLPSHLLGAPAGRKTEMGWVLLSETPWSCSEDWQEAPKAVSSCSGDSEHWVWKASPRGDPSSSHGVLTGWLERKHVQGLCVNREEGTEKKAEGVSHAVQMQGSLRLPWLRPPDGPRYPSSWAPVTQSQDAQGICPVKGHQALAPALEQLPRALSS